MLPREYPMVKVRDGRTTITWAIFVYMHAQSFHWLTVNDVVYETGFNRDRARVAMERLYQRGYLLKARLTCGVTVFSVSSEFLATDLEDVQ